MLHCERLHLAARGNSSTEPMCVADAQPAEPRADMLVGSTSAGASEAGGHHPLAWAPGLEVPHQIMLRSPPPQGPSNVSGIVALSTVIERCKQQMEGALSGRIPVPQNIYDTVYEEDFSSAIWNVGSCGIDRCMAYFDQQEGCPGCLGSCGAFLLWPMVMLAMFMPAQIACRVSKPTCPTLAHIVLSICSGASFSRAAITERSKARMCREALDKWSKSMHPSSDFSKSGEDRHPSGLLFASSEDPSMGPGTGTTWTYRVRPEVLAEFTAYRHQVNAFDTWCREKDIPYYEYFVQEPVAKLNCGADYVETSESGGGPPMNFDDLFA